MDRKTVVLGVAAVAAVTAAVIVTVANGHGDSPEHKATANYIKSADTLQQQMRVELTKATNAYRNFAGGKVTAKLAPQLAQAEATLRTLEQRLRVLPAPEVATKLRRLLVRLAAAQVDLAGEVARLAVFSPKFIAVLRSASKAGADLSKALGAVTPPSAHTIKGTKKQVAAAQAKFRTEAAQAAAAQAAAIDSYDAKIARLSRRLARLEPPEVMRPAYSTQRRTLAATRKAGAALAQELRKATRPDVAVYGRRFSIAARSATSISAQKAEISAVKAYNKRVREIGGMQAAIQGELARLQNTTG
jgi:hypothetical protein